MPEETSAPESRGPMMHYVELNLRDYWRIFRKRRWIALGVGFLVLGMIYGSARSQTRVYEAKAVIRLLEQESMGRGYMGFLEGSAETEISSFARVIESQGILERVVRELPLVEPGAPEDRVEFYTRSLQGQVSTRIVEAGHSLTNLIEIKVSDTNPQRAADIANKVAQVAIEEDLNEKKRKAKQVRVFVEQQLSEARDRLRRVEEAMARFKEKEAPAGSSTDLLRKLQDLQAQRAQLNQIYTPQHPDMQRLEEQIDRTRKELSKLSAGELEFARLGRAVEINTALYRDLEQRLAGARIAEAEHVGGVVVIDSALPNMAPVAPNVGFSLALGLILGTFAGGISALLVEQLDTSIGTIEDVTSIIKVPVIGVIPHFIVFEESARARKGKYRRFTLKHLRRQTLDEIHTRLYSHFYPKSPITEAFRTVRTFLRRDPNRRIILLTSTIPREGKTTILINLAVVCAQAGDRVLLVSLDLRKPQIARTFGVKRAFGISEVLAGAVPVESAIKRLSDVVIAGGLSMDDVLKTPGLDNLSFLPAGQIPSNPAELLSSPRLAQVLSDLRGRFDLVLIDSPPVLPITDALLIAPYVDGIVLVYQSGRTARVALARSKDQLEEAGGKLLGAILNDVRPEAEMDIGYTYYHRYRYYGQPGSSEETLPGEPAQA